ncbi:hypothetical protein KTR66_20885 [Roseococcus sp. SDR]|uniref:hypothetical protein n=1 Tax=Roseococcus sp. SDR TaxID=2835532 RepID=UPI001BCC5BCE|nr:hypothetical protein [Roseococcus sp. SDR]MBS7792461.1 hypothetical protein [Roseococcus sp. SDR]MBV1847775.1 hypothetical protein [Roseococcus sp. SDR]
MTEALSPNSAAEELDEWGMPMDAAPTPSVQALSPMAKRQPVPGPQRTKAKRKKRAPRAVEGEPRSRPLGIRLHPRERSALLAAVRRARRDDVSAWAREVLLAHAAKEDIPHVGDEALQELLRLRRDLNSGVGNNLNQAMVWANREAKMGRAPDRARLLEAVLAVQAGVEELRRDLERVLHPRGRR